MNDADALAEARDILAAGWCQGALHKSGTGRHTQGFAADRESSCMMGAIALVSQDLTQEDRLSKAAMKGISRLVGSKIKRPPCGVPFFNDARTTTLEDVLLAMKYAEEEAAE